MDYIYLVASNSLAKWYVHTNGLHLPIMDYIYLVASNSLAKWYVHTNGLHLPSGFQLIGQVVCTH